MVRWLRQQEILFTLLNPKFSITAWARADPRITFLLSHQVCRRRSRDSHIKRVDSFRMWWAGHFHHTATNTRNTGRDTFHFYWLYYQIYYLPAGDMRNLHNVHLFIPRVNGGEFSLAGSARKHWLRLLVLLRKLGGSGSPGQLLQQQQTKIVRSLGGGGAENQRKAKT